MLSVSIDCKIKTDPTPSQHRRKCSERITAHCTHVIITEMLLACAFEPTDPLQIEHEHMCVCVCVCVRVYVVYEDTNLYNDMGMTEVLQFEGVLWGHCLCPRNSKGLKNILNGVFLKI